MSQTITLTAVPGVPINQNLPSVSKIAVIDVANGTPFDLTYTGFGCPGTMVIEAGLKVRLYHETLDTGQMQITPVNNVGVTGTGIINVTVYFVNETVPKGTYPVAIPPQIVSAKVSSVITLSNEGGAVGTEVIDIGDVNFTKLIDIFNDGHFIWSVDQSNVKHQILKANTSGTPLQIGQSGDTTEVLSTTFLLDHNLNVTANLNFIDNGATARLFAAVNSVTNDNTIWTNANNGILHIRNAANSVDIATFNDTNTTLSVAGDIITGGKLQPNTGATTVNGSVGGNVTFVAPVWGSGLKILIAQLNAWNSASVGTFIFPNGTFTWGAFICGNDGTMTWGLNIGATAQTIHAIKTLGNNTTAGTDDALTAIRSNTVGWVDLTAGGADRIVIGTTGGAAITSTIVLIGN